MSLNWDLTTIENNKELCWVPSTEEAGKVELHTVTNVLIWATMLVGFSKITEKNYKDFHRRLIEWEVVADGMIRSRVEGGEWEDRMPTLQEVQAHIGLTTNASTKTNRQWISNLGTKVTEEASRRIHKEDMDRARAEAEGERDEQEKARARLVDSIMNQKEVTV
jgi:hypothetical protein|tara:strand:+ start:332 stop:823 length:492 start_codon:yes stop_codon:yes gene_type:complete